MKILEEVLFLNFLSWFWLFCGNSCRIGMKERLRNRQLDIGISTDDWGKGNNILWKLLVVEIRNTGYYLFGGV